MGFLRFETPRARYTLELELHKNRLESDIRPKEHDAVFKEGVFGKALTEAEMEKRLNEQPDGFEPKRRRLIEQAGKSGTEVWFGDFGVACTPELVLKWLTSPISATLLLTSSFRNLEKAMEWKRRRQKEPETDPGMTRREFLSMGLGIGKIAVGAAAFSLLPPSLLQTILLGEPGDMSRNELIRKSVVWFNKDLFPSAVIELRNAIAAKKLEELVAVTLARQKERKPSIALLYGAAHASLKEHLATPEVRDNLIEHFRPQFQKLGVNNEEMRAVYRCRYDRATGKWKVQKSEIKT